MPLCRDMLQKMDDSRSPINSPAWQEDIAHAIKRSYSLSALGSAPSMGDDLREVLIDRDLQKITRHLLILLKYRDIHARYERIAEAYQKTYEWIFRSPVAGDAKWSDFVQWAQGGECLH